MTDLTGFDLETCPFQAGLRTPPVVCAGVKQQSPRIIVTEDLGRELVTLFREPGVMLVGHNLSYDFSCLFVWYPELRELIWHLLENDQVLDTMHVERLSEICSGKPRGDLGLKAVAGRYGIEMPFDKGNGVQMSYFRVLDRPLKDYTEDQVGYLHADVVTPVELFKRQRKKHPNVPIDAIHDFSRRHFWLTQVSNYGFRTDPSKVGLLKLKTEERLAALREIALSPFALEGEDPPTEEELAAELRFDGRPRTKQERELARRIDGFRLIQQWKLNPKTGNPVKNTKRIQQIVVEAYDGRPPMTKKARDWKPTPKKPEFIPSVSTARATLEESGHPLLESFAEYGECAAIIAKDVPMLLAGAKAPVHTKFGFANSLRTTSAKPNQQNFSKYGGIRECVIPRPGMCFVAVDHTGMETACLAQRIVTALGRRGLADMLNRGESPLLHVAREIRGVSYEEALARYEAEDSEIKNDRNAAKVAVYGVPGGMSAKTLVLYAKNYGFVGEKRFTLPFAEQLIANLKAAIPDIPAYLNWVKRLPRSEDGRFFVPVPGSSVVRAGATFCSAANTGFQGLGANLEMEVGWHIVKATLTPGHILFGCRVVFFVHDEFILECPIGRHTEVAGELVRMMTEIGRRHLPDVKIGAKATCMSFWSKDAFSVMKDGELTIWNG